MSYTFYSSLHLISGLSLALVLGALWGIYTQTSYNPKIRSVLLFLHGLIMFFIFLAGFGLMARIKIAHFPWPLWIYIKLFLWLLLGLSPLLLKKTRSSLGLHYCSLVCVFFLLFCAILSVRLKF